MPEDNSHAGQGAVLLNIGGDVGALVVTMPAPMEGIEVEIRPVGAADGHPPRPTTTHARRTNARRQTTEQTRPCARPRPRPRTTTTTTHTHDDHSHDHASPWPHVAVVARPAPAGIVHSLVYSELQEGSYELYVRPHGPVELTVDVAGGYVTEAVWPRARIARGPHRRRP